MNVLVVYYSRSGNTEKVARSIAEALGADLEPIVDKTSRRGIRGYLRSGFEAATRRLTNIEQPKRDLSKYDLIILGSPVWDASMSSPMRTFLTQHRADLKNVAFFSTCGGRGAERLFDQMSSLSGKRPAAVLVLREHDLRGDYSAQVSRFVRELRILTQPEQPVSTAPAHA